MKPVALEADYLEAPFEVPRKYDDLRRFNRHGMNWLHRAAASHCHRLISNVLAQVSKEGISQLIDLVDKKDADGQTPIFQACIKEVNGGRLQTVKILIGFQATLSNLRSFKSGWTIAHWLCYHGDLETLFYLENSGLCCFIPDKNGMFPIDIAGQRGHVKLVSFLIKRFLAFRSNTEVMPKIAKGSVKVDDYHFCFINSDYLYLVVSYWALYYNRPTADLLPTKVGGILESIGAIFSMAVSDRSVKEKKKKVMRRPILVIGWQLRRRPSKEHSKDW